MDFSRPEEIDSWIEGLQSGSTRLLASSVYDTISELNSSRVVLRYHYQFLERIGPVVNNILRDLNKNFAEVSFPLESSVRDSAKISNNLCELLIRSYQNLLREVSGTDACKSNPGADDPCLSVWLTIAHRIFYYSQCLLVIRLSLNQEPDHHFWVRIYRIYVASLNISSRKREIGFPGVDGYPELSIVDMLNRLILISLLPLHALRSDQVREFFHTIDYWSEKIVLRYCDSQIDTSHVHFYLSAEPMTSPRPFIKRCGSCPENKCLHIDTSGLSSAIRNHLSRASISGQDHVDLTSGKRLTVSTLLQLKKSWTERAKRIERRVQCEKTVDVVFSTTAIYRALAAGEDSKHIVHHGSNKEKVIPISSMDSSVGLLDDFGELDELIVATQAATRKVTERKRRLASGNDRDADKYTFYKADVGDRSLHGFRLELEPRPAMPVHVGDLIGVRQQEKVGISLCIIRWYRETGTNHCSIGIEQIGRESAHATFTTEHSAMLGTNQPCLIAEHITNGKTMMVVDHSSLIYDKLVTLNFDGNNIPIAFKPQSIVQSKTVNAFEFGLRRGESNTLEAGQPLFDRVTLLALADREKGMLDNNPASETIDNPMLRQA